MKRWCVVLLSVCIVLLVLLIGLLVFRDQIVQFFFRPTPSSLEAGVVAPSQNGDSIVSVAQGLEVPWDVAFLPDDDNYLVTERPGRLQYIGEQTTTYEIADVTATSESGLLGVAAHPSYADNNFIYVYKTTTKGDQLINQVERYVLDGDGLHSQQVIVDDIPGAAIHDGGRIAFGPDGLLYIGTGDANIPDLAQDPQSLAGKILRVTGNGDIPEGNPFGTAIYSLGHRNVQGMAWDDEGRLWATEHGPTAHDELNLIEAGNNYGWPVVIGDETHPGMETPKRQSGSEETWAPSGLAYANGSLFFAGLRGQTLYEAVLDGTEVRDMQAHLREEYGRLRAVVARDNYLYVTTSNRDGRGNPHEGDDKVIQINLKLFNNDENEDS